MCTCNESSSSSSGSKSDPIEIDDSGEESEGEGEEKVRGPTPYPGVLVPVETDRAEDTPHVEVAGTSGMVRVPEPVSINTLLEIMVNLLLESGRQVCRKSYAVRRGVRVEPYRV